MDWSEDIDRVLDAIRLNCIVLCKRHKTRYFELKNSLKYVALFIFGLIPYILRNYYILQDPLKSGYFDDKAGFIFTVPKEPWHIRLVTGDNPTPAVQAWVDSQKAV